LLASASFLLGTAPVAPSAPPAAAVRFHADIEPLLEKYCYDCHGNGARKGRVAFDEFSSDSDLLTRCELWLKALKNVRAGLMPPKEDDDAALRPTAAEIEKLARWIKYDAFALDAANPDPGRVTARRLNRAEYHNTIRDLMGVTFDSEVEFPPDDTGGGFDNNGDVLTLPPLLLEKYLAAAETIVERAVPREPKVMRERVAAGRDFRGEQGGNGDQMSAKRAAHVAHKFKTDQTGTYRLAIEVEARGSFDFDPAHCTLTCRVDGEEKFTEDIVWHERKAFHHDYEYKWGPGEHVVAFELKPAAEADREAPATRTHSERNIGEGPAFPRPVSSPAKNGPRGSPTRLDVRIASVQLRGPIEPQFWVASENYARFFPSGPAPEKAAQRDRYASDVLRRFATRAFRRPVGEPTVQRLATIARSVYTQPGRTFEDGVRHAMMAVLASPRFLFRIENASPVPIATSAVKPLPAFAPIDEYALASRLSYFLWSTMPDETLSGLAQRGELRANLRAQVARMLKDARAQQFVRDFTGQWLQARDIEFVPINARAIYGGAPPPVLRTREGRFEFDSVLRKLMRSETEMFFDYIVREDRSVLELIDSDYTFLNEKLAAVYGVPGVAGEELRLVKLPPESARGGVLTQGTVLAVTSNPTRTSPVKRGLFVLENFLGTPPPPPPMAVPALEDAKKRFDGREPKLSEMLAVHRADKLCSSCHSRMDPLGLAFENFNALGLWREADAGQSIDPAGQLITGEKFADVRELKRVLTHGRREDFYRCLTEKLLTYALGRGLEYYDLETLDQIVARLDREDGRMSALLDGVIESAAFQKMRTQSSGAVARADAAR